MAFKVIRCGINYDLVVAVSPHTASPQSAEIDGAKFYRYLNDSRGRAIQFQEITYEAAMRYFSGHADGLGFEPLPTQSFASLDVMIDWVKTVKAPILSARHVQSLRAKIARRRHTIAKAQQDIAVLESELAMIMRRHAEEIA
jgi:hypothetical protein